jgi:hypothetical protein
MGVGETTILFGRLLAVAFDPEAEAEAAASSFLAAWRAALLFSLSGSLSLIPSSSLLLLRSFFSLGFLDPLLEIYDALLNMDGRAGADVVAPGVEVLLLSALERRAIRATSANRSEVDEVRA